MRSYLLILIFIILLQKYGSQGGELRYKNYGRACLYFRFCPTNSIFAKEIKG